MAEQGEAGCTPRIGVLDGDRSLLLTPHCHFSPLAEGTGLAPIALDSVLSSNQPVRQRRHNGTWRERFEAKMRRVGEDVESLEVRACAQGANSEDAENVTFTGYGDNIMNYNSFETRFARRARRPTNP